MSSPATTRVLAVDPRCPDAAALNEAARVLKGGGLVAFATETVYGLGADATNPAAVARIFGAKGRPSFNPLIVHASGDDMARTCVSAWPDAAQAIVDAFWPGPITLILPRSGRIPDVVTAGRGTVAVRVPELPVARQLIAAADRPIAAPSANRSTRISPTTARHVLDDLDGRIDLVLDSGRTTVGLESTVLDLSGGDPTILRPGPIGQAEIARVLPGRKILVLEPLDPHDATAARSSPGQMAVHYAPRTPALRVEQASELAAFPWPARAALLVVGPHDVPSVPARVHRFDLETPAIAARDLYVILHECDALDVDLVMVVHPPDRPEWAALRDRLGRATRRQGRD